MCFNGEMVSKWCTEYYTRKSYTIGFNIKVKDKSAVFRRQRILISVLVINSKNLKCSLYIQANPAEI